MKKIILFCLICTMFASCKLFTTDVSGYLRPVVQNENKQLEFFLSGDGLSYYVRGTAYTRGNVYMPSEYNGKPVTAIDAQAFKNNESITSFYSLSNITIGKAAFQGCSNLEAFVAPYLQNSVSESMFESCTSLEVVDIGTDVTTINASAFANCNKITSVIIPRSVNNISLNAFSGCTMLKAYVDSSAPTSGDVGSGWDSGLQVFYDTDWCNITFDSMEGSYISSIAVEVGDIVEDFPAPIKNGYTFVGWYEGNYSGKTVNSVTAGNTGEDVMLFAHWE